jgi:hypothetical protein
VCATEKDEVSQTERSQHASYPGPRAPRTARRGRSGVTAIAFTAVIGVLAVTIAMLSYQAATNDSGSDNSSELSALEARVDLLDGRLAAAQKTARRAAADAKASLAAVRKKPSVTSPRATPQPGLARCLTQVQREIDDLQAYLAFRTPPHRHRVTGACRTLLTPRFAG